MLLFLSPRLSFPFLMVGLIAWQTGRLQSQVFPFCGVGVEVEWCCWFPPPHPDLAWRRASRLTWPTLLPFLSAPTGSGGRCPSGCFWAGLCCLSAAGLAAPFTTLVACGRLWLEACGRGRVVLGVGEESCLGFVCGSMKGISFSESVLHRWSLDQGKPLWI